jgi:DNA-binding response OmpR family regulator
VAAVERIEDRNAGFAAMGALYLESQGMRPIVVSGSMAALDVFETQAIDVVVTDIKLGPGEPHGLALARMIRHKSPKMPVILMTVDPEPIEGESLPGPLLKKPFDFAELGRAIKELASIVASPSRRTTAPATLPRMREVDDWLRGPSPQGSRLIPLTASPELCRVHVH